MKETTQMFRLSELHLQLSLKKSQLSVISFINHVGEVERKQTAFSLVLRSELSEQRRCDDAAMRRNTNRNLLSLQTRHKHVEAAAATQNNTSLAPR